jgi:DNA-binding CsgD family transcriptional regulator
MPLAQARGIMHSLRWYHFGFAFFWVTVFVSLPATSADAGSMADIFGMVRQGVTIVALVGIALATRRTSSPNPRWAVVSGGMLGLGYAMCYAMLITGVFVLPCVFVSATLAGVAIGMFYLMWQCFYASEGTSRTTVYIPLSAALSVVLCALVDSLPIGVKAVTVVFVLPMCSVLTLYKSLRVIEPFDIAPFDATCRRKLGRDMWQPVFCVCTIGVVWRLVNAMVGTLDAPAFSVAMVGMCIASLVVAGYELFSRQGFDILRVYQLMFPLVSGVFMLPIFFGPAWMPLAGGTTMFGFEMVNLFLLIACAAYASRYMLAPTVVYATCVGPTLAALLVGDLLAKWLSASAMQDVAIFVDVLFLCIYGLAFALFATSLGRRGSSSRGAGGQGQGESQSKSNMPESMSASDARASDVNEPMSKTHVPSTTAGVTATDADADVSSGASTVSGLLPSDAAADALAQSVEQKLEGLHLVEPLSPREVEVVELLLRGNTVSAIARKLFISENTVRGHTKAIYRKLGIHSKQELIDLLG